MTGLASSFARNLHEISLDAEHIERSSETRHHRHPRGLGEGFVLGLSELGISLLGGLAGVAHHPLFALFPSSSSPALPVDSSSTQVALPDSSQYRLTHMAGALAGGVGRGLLGLVVKPLAGVADLVAFTGSGFMHGMGSGWGVTPSPNHIGW